MSSINGLSSTNIILWENNLTTQAGTSFGIKLNINSGKTEPGINPKLYFKFVKSKLEKLEQDKLRKKLKKLQEIVHNAKELGQQAFYEKLMESIAITVRELEVSAVGCDRWVSQEVIEKFLHKVYKPEGKKILFFEPWEKFPRTPPKEVQEKIKRIRDLNLFDEYFVLYLDYTAETLKSNKEKIKEKDPILFGRFSYAPNRYYFVADWIDEYCDLTFDKFIETMRAENPIDQKIPDLTSEYFDDIKKEVKERHDRLKNTNSTNFRSNMAAEDEKKQAGAIEEALVEILEQAMKKTLLIDMDCTLVDMLPPWLKRYNEITGANVQVSDIKEYDVGLVCREERVIYNILDEPGFFFNMDPMPGAQKYFQKLLDEGYDLVVVTQPPRRVDLAIRDKRRWMKKYFPTFELSNMIFCHRKNLVGGHLLFDDKPAHLLEWKKDHPDGILATLDWQFNRVKVNFRGSLQNGWEEFYDFVKKNIPNP